MKCKILESGRLTTLPENGVFVFGSNLQGIHGKGAAKDAEIYFEAKRGVGEGFTGKCYAFPTIAKLHPYTKVSNQSLKESVVKLELAVLNYPDKHFYITELGLGLAGFKEDEIIPLFRRFQNYNNVSLPKRFIYYYNNESN